MDQLPAPAPEVQGTPTISSGQLRYQDMMGTGETPLPEKDVLMERVAKYYPEMLPKSESAQGTPTGYPFDQTIQGMRFTPVGTPQKETPTMQEFPQCEAATISNSGGTWKCQLQSGHKGDHRAGYLFWEQKDHSADSAHPERCQFRKSEHRLCGALRENHGKSSHKFVPEGVQGKEPPHETPGPKQAPTEYQQVSRQIMARMRELHIPIPEGDCGPLQFFNAACASREAAGRRSAITEILEFAKDLMDNENLGNRALMDVIDWCAELLEKTK